MYEEILKDTQQRWKLQLQLFCEAEAVLGVCTNSPYELIWMWPGKNVTPEVKGSESFADLHESKALSEKNAQCTHCQLHSLHVKVTAAEAGDEIYPLLARGQKAESGMAASSLLLFPCARAVRRVSMLAPLQPLSLPTGNETDPSELLPVPCICFQGRVFHETILLHLWITEQ